MTTETIRAEAELALLDAGFSTREAAFAAQLLLHSELAASPSNPPDDVREWVNTFLPPDWICRLLANQVTEAKQGVNLYERAMQDPHLQGRLDRRADALGANNRDLIIGPLALMNRLDPRPDW